MKILQVPTQTNWMKTHSQKVSDDYWGCDWTPSYIKYESLVKDMYNHFDKKCTFLLRNYKILKKCYGCEVPRDGGVKT
jgi:hypothetical protein